MVGGPIGTSRDRLSLKDTHRFARSLAPSPRKVPYTKNSSLGVHQRTPLRRHRHAASTPGWPKPAFGERSPNLSHVPPLPFLPAPTVFSAAHPAGLLRPAADHGVRSVAGRSMPKHKSPFPEAHYPTERFPPWQPCRVTRVTPVHRGSYPLVVAPGASTHCCATFTLHPTSGFCSTKQSVARHPCFHERAPDAPMGFVLTWTFCRVTRVTEVTGALAAPKRGRGVADPKVKREPSPKSGSGRRNKARRPSVHQPLPTQPKLRGGSDSMPPPACSRSCSQ